MNITIFFLIATIGILIIYILVRESIYKVELEEETEVAVNAEDRAKIHFRKLYKIENLIKEEESKDLKDKNSYSLIRKIKEVITSDQTR
mgnify:FL=1